MVVELPCFPQIKRESSLSAHGLLNSLIEFRKRDKMRGWSTIFSFCRSEFNKFDNTEAQVLDYI